MVEGMTGDYVHPIETQYAVKEDLPSGAASSAEVRGLLCEACAHHQTIKVRQLAAYTPLDEGNYDEEIESYSQYLEIVYRLCQACELKVLEHLKKQDHLLLEKMEKSQVEKLREHKEMGNSDDALFKSFLTSQNTEHLPKRRYLPSFIFFFCLILAFALLVINVRLLAASTSTKLFSNSILQGYVDFLVQKLPSRTAVDTAEIIEYLGTALCFTGMFVAGRHSWYPEDALHVNLWVVCVVLSNRDVLTFLPWLAVRGAGHLIIALSTLTAAAFCVLRPRVPRNLDFISVLRRPISDLGNATSVTAEQKPIKFKRNKKGSVSQEAGSSSLHHPQRGGPDGSSLDNFLQDLNSFSLGSRKVPGASSSFWSVPAGAESSFNRSPSFASESSNEDRPCSPSGLRPVLSPSRLSFVSFGAASSSSSTTNMKSSPSPSMTSTLQKGIFGPPMGSVCDSLANNSNLSQVRQHGTQSNTSISSCVSSTYETSKIAKSVPPNIGYSPGSQHYWQNVRKPTPVRSTHDESRSTGPCDSQTSNVSTRDGRNDVKSSLGYLSKQTEKQFSTSVKRQGSFVKPADNKKMVDSIRRSSRIATKTRPWPLKKALSCSNANDKERAELAGVAARCKRNFSPTTSAVTSMKDIVNSSAATNSFRSIPSDMLLQNILEFSDDEGEVETDLCDLSESAVRQTADSSTTVGNEFL
ncbi:transmembrane protein 201 isoform X2 [Aplysia californica]|uniref:Transmembrane protein 201 isoform X2 n=1 Tax=Aplysia californica TaxID=6500 RepID=A0ABM1VQ61_APLCA|nr:transmembrane protein 201 isoform X2 [Aplysia californica]